MFLMDCQTTGKIMKINKDKSIGRVLFIIEGESTEQYILHKIFTKIFDYDFTRVYRDGKFYKYTSKSSKNPQVFIINAEDSNIKFIGEDGKQYLDKIFNLLITDYNFRFENAAIYYIFDRDNKSNTDTNLIYNLLSKLDNSREETKDYERQGLLLLSYPSIESFTASNFLADCFNYSMDTGDSLKKFLNDNKIIQNKINANTLIVAAEEMYKAFAQMGISYYNIDDFSQYNINIFRWQENHYRQKSLYRLLSLLSITFIDLGLIEVE